MHIIAFTAFFPLPLRMWGPHWLSINLDLFWSSNYVTDSISACIYPILQRYSVFCCKHMKYLNRRLLILISNAIQQVYFRSNRKIVFYWILDKPPLYPFPTCLFYVCWHRKFNSKNVLLFQKPFFKIIFIAWIKFIFVDEKFWAYICFREFF